MANWAHRSGRVGAMLAAPRAASRENRVAAADDRHDRFSDRLLGRDQGRRRAGAGQHAAVDRPLRAPSSIDCRRERCDRLQELLPASRPLLVQLPHIVRGLRGAATRRRARSISRAELGWQLAAPTAPASPDECAFWLYSSGCTGQPKGVRHAHASLKYTADTLWRASARASSRTTSSFPPPNCSSPMGSATR